MPAWIGQTRGAGLVREWIGQSAKKAAEPVEEVEGSLSLTLWRGGPLELAAQMPPEGVRLFELIHVTPARAVRPMR